LRARAAAKPFWLAADCGVKFGATVVSAEARLSQLRWLPPRPISKNGKERIGDGMEVSNERVNSIVRERRAAKNQALFREVNERIEPLNQAFTIVNRLNDFVCECPNDDCTDMIALSVEEYESVRANAEHFAVAPDDAHVWPDVERVIEKRDRYWLVEKSGEAGAMAAKLDPRAR
jgi:hypothetical protein